MVDTICLQKANISLSFWKIKLPYQLKRRLHLLLKVIKNLVSKHIWNMWKYISLKCFVFCSSIFFFKLNSISLIIDIFITIPKFRYNICQTGTSFWSQTNLHHFHNTFEFGNIVVKGWITGEIDLNTHTQITFIEIVFFMMSNAKSFHISAHKTKPNEIKTTKRKWMLNICSIRRKYLVKSVGLIFASSLYVCVVIDLQQLKLALCALLNHTRFFFVNNGHALLITE